MDGWMDGSGSNMDTTALHVHIIRPHPQKYIRYFDYRFVSCVLAIRSYSRLHQNCTSTVYDYT